MKLAWPCAFSLFVVAVLFLAIAACANPVPPGPPLPEQAMLWQDRFDTAYERSGTETEVSLGSYRFRESWSGYALERTGVITPFVIPGIDSEGYTNLMSTGNGALRFWLKPSWSSVTAPLPGKGPGAFARLAELNVSRMPDAVWSLQVVPDGSSISLVAQSESGPQELLQAPIAWSSGVFHLIALNFGPQGTALLIDGRLAAEGPGTLAVPPKISSLVLGSTATGLAAIDGDLEEAASFARSLTENEIAIHYRAYRDCVVSWQLNSMATGGKFGSTQISSMDAATMDVLMTLAEPPPLPGGGGGGGGGGNPGTNTPPIYMLGLGLCLYQPIITSSNSLTLILTNAPDSGWLTNIYDLFYTTNMASLAPPALCVTNWAWLARTTPGQTNLPLTNLPNPECFFRLGTMQDSDGDGLTDAYELLCSHTDPHNPDTDGDGLSDFDELVAHTDPLVSTPTIPPGPLSVPMCPQ